uniref:Uncharacterized protein n=1 Tax=Strix occidentalis caurina TaxID=311401 RepID=A0A8D0FYJ1_STROC
MHSESTQPFPLPLSPLENICSSLDYSDQVTAHTLVGLQELVQVLQRNLLTSNYRHFTIKQAGKPSTNVTPRKSLEHELCFTGQKELRKAGCSAVMPTLNTRGPSLATAHGWTPGLLTSRDY